MLHYTDAAFVKKYINSIYCRIVIQFVNDYNKY